MEVNPIDLPTLRAVIAGVRKLVETWPKSIRISCRPSDLTTLASACERLAEENERARERIAALTPPDGYVFVLCAPELANQMMNQWSDPVQLKVDSVEANWMTFVARKFTPAPAGKGEG